jgi:hypothetical protein
MALSRSNSVSDGVALLDEGNKNLVSFAIRVRIFFANDRDRQRCSQF